MVSLFSALNTGETGILAQSAALRVAGQNIANANTDGYARQRVRFEATEPDDVVFAQIGTGVRIAKVERLVDQALEAAIRQGSAREGGLRARDDVLRLIEATLNEFSEADISDAISSFFTAVEDVSQNVEDLSARQQVVATGETLADQIRFLAERLRAMRVDADTAVRTQVQEVNRILGQIADLNARIVQVETGQTEKRGDANDLRDQRDRLLRELSRILEVRAFETEQGSVTVLAGSDLLVQDAQAFQLSIEDESDGQITRAIVRVAETGVRLTLRDGEMAGRVLARDVLIPQIQASLDTLARGVIFEVNKLHSEGRGLVGLTDVTSEHDVSSPTVALSAAGLPFAPRNGSFAVNVRTEATGEIRTFNIDVDLDGIGAESTLATVVAEFAAEVTAAFPDITATIDATRRLVIRSANPQSFTFSFSDDSSDLLAALGLNGLFSGEDALTIGVSDAIAADPRLLAASSGSGAQGDNGNALRLAQLRTARVLSNGTETLEDFYAGLTGTVGVLVADTRDRRDNQEALNTQLLNERENISGVSLDEEAIDLIRFQRAFQGAARFISIVDELLETLIESVG